MVGLALQSEREALLSPVTDANNPKRGGYVNGGVCGQLPAELRHVVWCFFCRRRVLRGCDRGSRWDEVEPPCLAPLRRSIRVRVCFIHQHQMSTATNFNHMNLMQAPTLMEPLMNRAEISDLEKWCLSFLSQKLGHGITSAPRSSYMSFQRQNSKAQSSNIVSQKPAHSLQIIHYPQSIAPASPQDPPSCQLYSHPCWPGYLSALPPSSFSTCPAQTQP